MWAVVEELFFRIVVLFVHFRCFEFRQDQDRLNKGVAISVSLIEFMHTL